MRPRVRQNGRRYLPRPPRHLRCRLRSGLSLVPASCPVLCQRKGANDTGFRAKNQAPPAGFGSPVAVCTASSSAGFTSSCDDQLAITCSKSPAYCCIDWSNWLRKVLPILRPLTITFSTSQLPSPSRYREKYTGTTLPALVSISVLTRARPFTTSPSSAG